VRNVSYIRPEDRVYGSGETHSYGLEIDRRALTHRVGLAMFAA
jgi:hypothetical protein